MSKKYTLLTFKGICMNFLLELKFFILSHPVTSKQPHKIVQIHMGHPVHSALVLKEFLKPFTHEKVYEIIKAYGSGYSHFVFYCHCRRKN